MFGIRCAELELRGPCSSMYRQILSSKLDLSSFSMRALAQDEKSRKPCQVAALENQA
jgi:hypothetical protein